MFAFIQCWRYFLARVDLIALILAITLWVSWVLSEFYTASQHRLILERIRGLEQSLRSDNEREREERWEKGHTIYERTAVDRRERTEGGGFNAIEPGDQDEPPSETLADYAPWGSDDRKKR